MKIRSDFVTNSSSSSFVVSSRPMSYSKNEESGLYVSLYYSWTRQEIIEKLELIIDFYNKIFDKGLMVDDVFTVSRWTKKKYDDYMKYLLDHVNKEPEMYLTHNCSHIMKCQSKDAIGKWIITSKRDNSIPYELFVIIEEAFYCYEAERDG